MSFSGGFRRLQVMYDLSELAKTITAATAWRIASAVPGATVDEVTSVLSGGSTAGLSPDTADAVRLGAAQPDEDFDAFTACLALLIIDRLQHGELSENLHWAWESHHKHISLADPVARAALVQGMISAQDVGLDRFGPPPFDHLRSTEDATQIMDALEDMLGRLSVTAGYGAPQRDHDPLASTSSAEFVPSAAAVIYGTLQSPERVDVTNALWRRHGATLAAMQDNWARTIVRAVRHIYEVNSAFDPWPNAVGLDQITVLPTFAARSHKVVLVD